MAWRRCFSSTISSAIEVTDSMGRCYCGDNLILSQSRRTTLATDRYAGSTQPPKKSGRPKRATSKMYSGSMTQAERQRRVTDIFEMAAHLHPEERRAFTEQECQGDTGLIEEVSARLAEYD